VEDVFGLQFKIQFEEGDKPLELLEPLEPLEP
jgi:hypothetical protein